MSRFLDKLSRTPGLITPFDKEFNEAPEYTIIQEIRVPPSEPQQLWDNIDQPSVRLAGATDLRVLDGGVIPGINLLSLEPVHPAGASHGFADTSTASPTYIDDLRESIPPERVLTLGNGDTYVPLALTSNLLYARKAPGAVVVPENEQHIRVAIECAKQHKIPLTVQGGGHSYAGYALNHKGILIDMRDFKKIHVDLQEKTVTIGAGCRWIEVYNHFKDKGYKQMVLGGKCRGVGVSGYILGGGISPFSRGYGLGIDNVTEMKIVTASGKFVTVPGESEDANTKSKLDNLFWALRGGGGGNFGILTEFTTKIHDLADPGGEVIYGSLTWELNLPGRQKDFETVIQIINSKTWTDKITIDIIWQDKGKDPAGQLMVMYDGSMGDYQKEIAEFSHLISDSRVQKCSWQDVAVIEQGWYAESPAFHHHTSFVLKQGQLTRKFVKKIGSLMEETRNKLSVYDPDGKAYLIWVHIGEETAVLEANDTAFPWRDAAYVGYFKLQWYKGGIMDKMVELVKEAKMKLLPSTMGEVAYVNFVDRTIPNWQRAYYGDNYERLQKVKEEWDPEDFFKFEQSIELPKKIGESPCWIVCGVLTILL
ncbi:unnamed protein product [Rhizoctonia solani]|uniref:FAD-binding PCMH-type domain-containing protein n=1 Tax=Rhizoctonia solani TaxID=456999 RepID=A0A8H3A666_9AGAM|nr:unnamed protein product [Rhizoctonia solani]